MLYLREDGNLQSVPQAGERFDYDPSPPPFRLKALTAGVAMGVSMGDTHASGASSSSSAAGVTGPTATATASAAAATTTAKTSIQTNTVASATNVTVNSTVSPGNGINRSNGASVMEMMITGGVAVGGVLC